MQEAFAKLKGVDIFSLKSYMEPTNFGSFNGAWVLINEAFRQSSFFSFLITIFSSIKQYLLLHSDWHFFNQL